MIDIDAKRYATCDDDAPSKRMYRPDDDFLVFKRSVRFAAIDVMILTYAARRHAQWLRRIGICPPDVAELIVKDLDAIRGAVAGAAASTPTPHVGPRSRPAEGGEGDTKSLYRATRANVGQRGQSAKEVP